MINRHSPECKDATIFSMSTFSITTLSIMTLSIMTPSIMTFGVTKLIIMSLFATLSIYGIQPNGTQHTSIE
jgi:hypothetical protein